MTKSYNNLKSKTASLAILLGLVLIAPPSGAKSESEGLPLWELGIGAAAYHQPNYPGSDVRSTTGFPFPYVIYRGDWFRIDRSLQGILYETQRIKADFSAGATSIVDSDESNARDSMPDLDPTFDIGPALSVLLTNPPAPAVSGDGPRCAPRSASTPTAGTSNSRGGCSTPDCVINGH